MKHTLIRSFAFATLLFFSRGTFAGPLHYPPARWLDDNDRQPISKPYERHEYKYIDYADKHLFYQLERLTNIPLQVRALGARLGMASKQEALNVNNFDEVADSTWFTNRLGRFPLSTPEIVKGPNQSGLDMRGPWKIISAKTVGLSPGFTVEDAKGDRYILKFDPKEASEMATGAEVIGTKILHAFGYHVPENSLVEFDASRLVLTPKAYTYTNTGKKRPFTQEDLQESFNKISLSATGHYRALASKYLPGEPVGPFSLRGRRGRDKNDRIPHEHRRELRGYRVASAFINNTDTRESNSLDMFIREDGSKKGYVRHYLIDFGSALGSSTDGPKSRNHLYDYTINPWKMLEELLTLGIYKPYWEQAAAPEYSSLGFFESRVFDPGKWRPTYANPPFQNMTDRDGFWAAKIIMNFSDQDIAAIVREAHYSEPEVTRYVTKTLMERRDKIGRHWFSRMSPLDDFAVSGNALVFQDLAVQAGFQSPSQAQYRYRPLHGSQEWINVSAPSIPLPSELMGSTAMKKPLPLEIQSHSFAKDEWNPSVVVYVENDGSPLVVGLKRKY